MKLYNQMESVAIYLYFH